MIDLHSHLVPAVDDGAADLDAARAALQRMRESGVHALVTTPHFNASATQKPERAAAALNAMDPGWERLRVLAETEFPEVRVERGVELMLDAPGAVLDDPRLRLAGTRFALVEFPFHGPPPGSSRALFDLGVRGWKPVLAHPERYPAQGAPPLEGAREWRRMGALLQVNWGSLMGRYGAEARDTAWLLLKQGWVSYLSSDHHARGKLGVNSARQALLERGGEEQLRLLSEENPARLLRGEAPLEVPPLERPRTFWDRILRRG